MAAVMASFTVGSSPSEGDFADSDGIMSLAARIAIKFIRTSANAIREDT